MAVTWLAQLEEQVRSASQELVDLRKKNRSLARKTEKLQAQLGEQSAAGRDEWEAERAELKKRVEKLISQLDSLA